MPAKKKPAAKPKAKAGARTKAVAKPRKGDALVCRVCGYRLIVDRACGCATEHTYVCCGQRMTKAPARRAAAR